MNQFFYVLVLLNDKNRTNCHSIYVNNSTCHPDLIWYLSLQACYTLNATITHSSFLTSKAYTLFVKAISRGRMNENHEQFDADHSLYNYESLYLCDHFQFSLNNTSDVGHLPFHILSNMIPTNIKNQQQSIPHSSTEFRFTVESFLDETDRLNWRSVWKTQSHLPLFSGQLLLLFTLSMDEWNQIDQYTNMLPKSLLSHNRIELPFNSSFDNIHEKYLQNMYWLYHIRIGMICFAIFVDVRPFHNHYQPRWCLSVFPLNQTFENYVNHTNNQQQERIAELIHQIGSGCCWLFDSFWSFYSLWRDLCILFSFSEEIRQSSIEHGIKVFNMHYPFN